MSRSTRAAEELLRPEDFDASRREGTADERPLSLDEGQHAVHRHVVAKDVEYDRDLLEHSVHDPRAVSSANEELLDSRPQDPALDLESRATAVPLRVHYVDA